MTSFVLPSCYVGRKTTAQVTNDIRLHVGAKVHLPGHVDAPVILEEARLLPNGYECPVRLPDGTVKEAAISPDEARITTNEWYKATQLGDSFWLYVVWDSLGKPEPEPLRIQNLAKYLDHAKKEIVAARCFDIPSAAIEQAAKGQAT